MNDYDPATIEPRWQQFWADKQTFAGQDDSTAEPFYVLDMFPYPSGAGLHIGHPEGYTASDALKRFKKAQGYNVLHPMGWDAFGLPTEQYAVQTGARPADTTKKNVARFKEQLARLGFAYDWNREINTTDPGYFRWTQWIFLQLFKHGLAYVDEKPVWYCPALGTVLANEEVLTTPEGPRSERGSHPVERKALRQWVLRITEYAEKLLEGLDDLNWPDSTKRLQANWIGRSEGAHVRFALDGYDEKLTVFTTRPDTLYGATYMVIAPEHPLVERITTAEQQAEVRAYVAKAANKSDLDRTDLAKDKTGVFTGAYAINPVNFAKIPVWVADYVLMSYGTGAIMAVPAHDERDYAFAKTFDLPIIQVIDREGEETELPYTGPGVMVNSGEYDGLEVETCKSHLIANLEADGEGEGTVNYKLRDWLFSRQRYWGEPFPILWVDEAAWESLTQEHTSSDLHALLPEEPVTCVIDGQVRYAVPVPEKDLPLRLPEVENYQPAGTGESPLAKATEWVEVFVDLETGTTLPRSADLPEHGVWVRATRETNTMPQWAGSCWYYLRYLDPKNDGALVAPEKEKYWGTPDLYIGGAEHAVLHLLYARFWHRFLFDIGVVSEPEPFQRLFHQGIILGEDGEKMSKSRGNVVNPDAVIDEYGADAVRLYLMFLGPLEAMKPWSTTGIEGIARFLRKAWRELTPLEKRSAIQDQPAVEKTLHASIKKVTEDYEALRFNTAISQLMILLNTIGKAGSVTPSTAKTFVQLLAPLAPHIAEELWQVLGGQTSVAEAPWPVADESKLTEEQQKIVVQVNGKVRGEIYITPEVPKEAVLSSAKEHEKVKAFTEGKTLVKEIYVPGKIVNLVVK